MVDWKHGLEIVSIRLTGLLWTVLQVAGLVFLSVGAIRVLAPWAPPGELFSVVLIELYGLVGVFPEVGPVSYVIGGLFVSGVGLAGSARSTRIPASA